MKRNHSSLDGRYLYISFRREDFKLFVLVLIELSSFTLLPLNLTQDHFFIKVTIVFGYGF